MNAKLRPFLLFAVILLVGGVSWAMLRHSPPKVQTKSSAPKTAPQNTKAQRVPYDPQQARATAEFWEARVKEDPTGALGWGNLAEAYARLMRETGDISYAQRSEKATRRSLQLLPGPSNNSSYNRLGHSLLTQHRFKEALKVADRIADKDTNAQRLRVDVLTELGRYGQAQKALLKIPYSGADPNWAAMQARLWEIEGRNPEAIKALQRAVKSADAQLDWPAETVAWFHYRLGQAYFNVGKADEARAQWQQGVEIFPRDYRSLTGLARLSAGQEKWDEALKYGTQAADIVPSLEIVALLGDVYQARGEADKAREQWQIIGAMRTLAKVQGTIYDRQRALFNADHDRDLDEALQLARGEIEQRQDVYAYDTLAWTSYKKGLLPQARGAMQKALAQGTRDALLEYHAGMIAEASGDRAKAKAHLQRALEFNPYFHPLAPRRIGALLQKWS